MRADRPAPYLSRAMSRSPILAVALASLAILAGCDAVTNPLEDQPDPRPVTGDWYTVSVDGPPDLDQARIEGGGAPFFGEFRFPLHGRTWFVGFRDAGWTGRVLSFTTRTDFGFTLPDSTIHWTATLARETGTPGTPGWSPARLTLRAHTVDGVAFLWDYFRLEDARRLFPAPADRSSP